MLGIMSRPKKQPGRDRHREPREVFHLPPELREALAAYVASVEPATTRSAVVRLALQRFLTDVGFWPPAAGKGGGK
jgi:hypothetical protein